MEIPLQDLEKCFLLLFRLLHEGGFREVNPGNYDYYWRVLAKESFMFDKEPELAVGSLDDDIEELKNLAKDPSRASSVDFERLAAVLIYLSEVCYEDPSA
ncbi:MAG: hypothetical protein GY847_06885 [Proteobacteria bacterium]|nr:hypothetical protein [Pseudomonadota bacterium]